MVIVPPESPYPVATLVTVPPASIKVSVYEIFPDASIRNCFVPDAAGSPDILTPRWNKAPLATVSIESGEDVPMPRFPLKYEGELENEYIEYLLIPTSILESR